MNTNIIKLAIEKCKNNAFNKPSYQVDLPMDDLIEYFLRFLNRDKMLEIGKEQAPSAYVYAVFERTPPFQRNNDKWTSVMQSSFVRNVLLGIKPPPLIFYSLSDTKSDCYILDGLQRITALTRFFTDADMEIPFDNNVVLTAKEILENDTFQRMLWNLTMPLRIYQFNSEREAVEHYIEMNDQITHSQDDILKAKKYLETIEG